MKKIKTLLEAVVVVTVVLAFIIPSSAVVTNDESSPGIIQNKVKSYTKILSKEGINRGENILMPSFAGDDRLPSITKDNTGHTVVTWTNEEDVLTWNMGIAYSDTPTDPMSWTGYIVTLSETTMVWYSDTAYIDGPNPEDYDGLYGVNMYYDVDLIGGYQISDITQDPSDPAYWSFFYWGDQISEDQVCRAVEDGPYYDEPNYDHVGPISMVIYHWADQGYDVPGCPIYTNQDLVGGSTTFYYDAQTELKSAPARDCDYATLPAWFHLTWEYYNETTDKDMIVWKKIDPAVQPDIEYTPWQEYVAEGTNPSIEAYDDARSIHVAIVYVNEGSVKCVYSADDGETWSAPVTIADGSYPALRVIGKTLYCAYISDGNLYLVTSDNGGMTWSSAEQINEEDGTVVEEENSVDIHASGVVWVDSRGDDLDIYFTKFLEENNPPNAPNIIGPSTGKAGEALDFIFNAVDPDGNQVKYIIDWGDTNTEETGLNPSGQDVTVPHTYSAKGTYIIKAKAQDSFGLTGPETEKTITVPKNKALNLPFFKFLQNYQNLLQILKYLFGL